jgi:hypothetical protein
MKGIVFAEFLDLIEDQFGLDITDEILEEADLPSGGAYTNVGTYDHQEMLTLVTLLSQKTSITVEKLMNVFGEHLLTRFVAAYPQFFSGVDNCYAFLDTIENKVHVEVQKLYPEAELPTFETIKIDDKEMHLLYCSNRPFTALAYGLIIGSATYFGEALNVEMSDMSSNQKTKVLFKMNKA